MEVNQMSAADGVTDSRWVWQFLSSENPATYRSCTRNGGMTRESARLRMKQRFVSHVWHSQTESLRRFIVAMNTILTRHCVVSSSRCWSASLSFATSCSNACARVSGCGGVATRRGCCPVLLRVSSLRILTRLSQTKNIVGWQCSAVDCWL